MLHPIGTYLQTTIPQTIGHGWMCEYEQELMYMYKIKSPDIPAHWKSLTKTVALQSL